jgi:hypothetical protein
MGSKFYHDLPWVQPAAQAALGELAISAIRVNRFTLPHIVEAAAGRVMFLLVAPKSISPTYMTRKCVRRDRKPQTVDNNMNSNHGAHAFVGIDPSMHDGKLPGLARMWLDVSTITVLPNANQKYLYLAYLPADCSTMHAFQPSPTNTKILLLDENKSKSKSKSSSSSSSSNQSPTWLTQLRFHLVQVEDVLEIGTKHANLATFLPDGCMFVMAGEIETVFGKDRHVLRFNDSSGTFSSEIPQRTKLTLSRDNPHQLDLEPYTYDAFQQAMAQSPALASIYHSYVDAVANAAAADTDTDKPVKLERLHVWSVDLLARIMRQFLFGMTYPFVHAWELEYVDAIVFDESPSYIARLCQVPSMQTRLLAYDTEDACTRDSEVPDVHEFDEPGEWHAALTYARAQYADYAGLSSRDRMMLENTRNEAYSEYTRQIKDGELAPDTPFIRDDGQTEEQIRAAARFRLDEVRKRFNDSLAKYNYVCAKKK